MPPSRVMRSPYLFYLRHAIPILGRLLLGDPWTYRMLGVYTTRYGDSRAMAHQLRAAGLDAEHRRVFFGCATGVVGGRPEGHPAPR